MVTLVTLGVFLSNVLFCSLFVPRYGALGAAWAVAIGQVLSLSFCWAVTYRLIGTIPDVVRMAYYLGSSVTVFFVVRTVSVSPPKLELAIKVLVGIVVYATLLLFYRKRASLLTKGKPDYAS
jgi:O-antigen/teichoic acid export membrane protein